LPALSIRRNDLRKALRIVTAAWMFGIVWGSLVGGDQTRILGDMLGFQDWHFTLLIALGPLATLGQFFSVFLIERTGLRKYQFMEFGAIGRLLWLAIAALPLVFSLPSTAGIYAMMIVLFTSSFCDSLATPAWMTWMAYLIPRRVRGRYFAVRQKWTQVVQVVTVLAAGAIIDAVTAPHGSEAHLTACSQPALLRTVCVMFAVSAGFGVTDILLFRGIRDVLPNIHKPAKPVPVSLRFLLDPLKERVFLRYVLFAATIQFSNAVGGWFYFKNCRESLGFSSLSASIILLAIPPITQILCARWWGRLVDRWGRRPVLLIGGVGIAVTMIPHMLASPYMDNPHFLADAINGVARLAGAALGKGNWQWVDYQTPISSYLIILSAQIFGAAAWAGVNLAQNAVMLGFAEGHGGGNQLAASNFLSSMGGLLGAFMAMVATYLLKGLHNNPILVGPFLWNAWHFMFLLAMVSRIVALFWIKGMPDPGAASVGDLLRSAGSNFYGNVVSTVLFPLRVFGWKPGGAGGEGRNHDARD
jgi:MFS family permease